MSDRYSDIDPANPVAWVIDGLVERFADHAPPLQQFVAAAAELAAKQRAVSVLVDGAEVDDGPEEGVYRLHFDWTPSPQEVAEHNAEREALFLEDGLWYGSPWREGETVRLDHFITLDCEDTYEERVLAFAVES